jgi:nucleoside-diphosphate-sugar epimerase
MPASIRDEAHLEELLSAPSQAAVEAIAKLEGDIVLLGVGGKMGPTLSRMIRRAAAAAGRAPRVYAVSRFSNAALVSQLHRDGVETIPGDLLDESFVAGLPDAANVVFMTGMKFGTADDPSATWAVNTYVPALVCRRYRHSRIVAFSTGNVYPFVPVGSRGSVESDRPEPVGEYGMSALGRERTFEFFSRRDAIPTTILRLNYAVEMRYGVLVDLARLVSVGHPIDLSMGYANVIWQGDANAMAVAALADASSPPFVVNVAGPELMDVRQTCEQFARLLDRPVTFTGTPASTALLSNGSLGHARYGRPRVPLEQLIEWAADWIRRDGVTWNKPTHFQARDGRF